MGFNLYGLPQRPYLLGLRACEFVIALFKLAKLAAYVETLGQPFGIVKVWPPLAIICMAFDLSCGHLEFPHLRIWPGQFNLCHALIIRRRIVACVYRNRRTASCTCLTPLICP